MGSSHFRTITKALILLTLLTHNAARAQDNGCISYIGLCHPKVPCAEAIGAFAGASQIRTGWLDNTFAPSCECGRKLLALPKEKIVRIHILNGPCLRNRRCGSYEVLSGYTVQSAQDAIKRGDQKLIGRFIERVRAVRALVEGAAKNTRLLLSPCLECDFDKAARLKLISIAQREYPGIEIVDNPLRDSCIPGFICEKHGERVPPIRPPYIVDLDGSDYAKVDGGALLKQHTKALMNCAWTAGNNLSAKLQKFVDPRARSKFTTEPELKMLAHFVKPGAANVSSPLNPKDIAQCKKKFPASDGAGKFVWKLSDGRPNAVALFPNTFRRFSTVKAWKDGRVVDTLKKRAYNYTEDGSNRQIWDASKHSTAFPDNIIINADGNCWQIAKPGFRAD